MLHKNTSKELTAQIKSPVEENANMLSHAFGLLLFVITIPFLIRKAQIANDHWVFCGTLLYGVSLLMVYTSSTLYHKSKQLVARKKLRIFDHISIYFLIAGTYTPFILKYLQNTTGWITLITLWSTVLLGSIFKLFFTHKFNLFSTLAYLAMGWAAVFIAKPLYDIAPTPCIIWIGVGGVFYTIGTFFYLKKNLFLGHFIWHLFVLGGSISHFIAVWSCFKN